MVTLTQPAGSYVLLMPGADVVTFPDLSILSSMFSFFFVSGKAVTEVPGDNTVLSTTLTPVTGADDSVDVTMLDSVTPPSSAVSVAVGAAESEVGAMFSRGLICSEASAHADVSADLAIEDESSANDESSFIETSIALVSWLV